MQSAPSSPARTSPTPPECRARAIVGRGSSSTPQRPSSQVLFIPTTCCISLSLSSHCILSLALTPFKVTAFEGASLQRITFSNIDHGKRQHSLTLSQGFSTKNAICHCGCNTNARYQAVFADIIAADEKNCITSRYRVSPDTVSQSRT